MPFRHLCGTPRALSRPKFLSALMKGESRSALSSRCPSKTSVSSLGTNPTSRQKSPPPAPARISTVLPDSAGYARMDSDSSEAGGCPQSQGSNSENMTPSISSPSSPPCPAHSNGMHDIPSVCFTAGSQLELQESPHQNHRVTFEEPQEASSAGDVAGTDLQLLLIHNSASAGTLVSDSGHGGSCCHFDDTDQPTGSDSEQLTINSRTLLLHSNKL